MTVAEVPDAPLLLSSSAIIDPMIEPSPLAPWWHQAFAARADPAMTMRLDRAATLLSAHRSRFTADPADIDTTLAGLDRLASESPGGAFEDWHRHLFVTCAFAGNGNDYHDVRNSFLPDVLQRRLGIPISLAIVGIAVAERLGLAMWGVGMPGHFLLGYAPNAPGGVTLAGLSGRKVFHDPAETIFIDPFNGGELLDLSGVEGRYRSTFGEDKQLDYAMLAPTPDDTILVRMLANLKANYARTRDVEGLTAVMRMRSCLPGMVLDEGRELVRLLDAVGCWDEASFSLDQLDVQNPLAVMELGVERDRLRARLN